MGRPDSSAVFCFGEFELDPDSGQLRRAGARVALQEQPLQLLSVLLQDAGKLVRREELRQRLWPENTYVEFDHALNTAVKKIRIALGDCADSPRYVETIPKRGYRFIAPVSLREGGEASTFPNQGSSAPVSKKIALSGVLTALLLLCLGALGMRWWPGRTGAETKPAVLAVLPLEDLSDDSSGATFCDGLGEQLTTQLGQADPAHLAVTSRAATLSYRHTNKSVAEVARELRAAYLLEGNVRGDMRRVCVTMELIRTDDELQVWGEGFDRDGGDALTLERELAAEIAKKASAALAAERSRK
jgi:DNA-binding winged helix-turn-helix (wHTH) protein/TolB-like protein